MDLSFSFSQDQSIVTFTPSSIKGSAFLDTQNKHLDNNRCYRDMANQIIHDAYVAKLVIEHVGKRTPKTPVNLSEFSRAVKELNSTFPNCSPRTLAYVDSCTVDRDSYDLYSWAYWGNQSDGRSSICAMVSELATSLNNFRKNQLCLAMSENSLIFAI